MSNRIRRTAALLGAAAVMLGFGVVPIDSAHAQMGQETPKASSSSDPADAALAARVQQALKNDPTLNSRHLKVFVQKGEVTLSGTAEDNRVIVAAQQVATKSAPGHTIINNIQVRQGYPNAP
jgi:osmotically-inducible protein OsmY